MVMCLFEVRWGHLTPTGWGLPRSPWACRRAVHGSRPTGRPSYGPSSPRTAPGT